MDPSVSNPFDYQLPRTPYFVVPKLALQSMPIGWQHRLCALMQEMEDAGISTPNYYVFRNHDASPPGDCKKVGTWEHPFYKIMGKITDEWADYRHHTVPVKPTLRTRILEAFRFMSEWPMFRHAKRNTNYMVLTFNAKLQSANPIEEGALLTVYLAEEDGQFWCRPMEEFSEPGRFERIEEDAN